MIAHRQFLRGLNMSFSNLRPAERLLDRLHRTGQLDLPFQMRSVPVWPRYNIEQFFERLEILLPHRCVKRSFYQVVARDELNSL